MEAAKRKAEKLTEEFETEKTGLFSFFLLQLILEIAIEKLNQTELCRNEFITSIYDTYRKKRRLY